MKRLFVVLLMLGLSVNLMAQKESIKQKGDSTVYFYGSMKLNSGLHVVTGLDSISATADRIEPMLATINQTNIPRVLSFARTELGNDRLVAELRKQTNILEIRSNKQELRGVLNEFLRLNDGKVYTLQGFSFTKPGKNEGAKITRYE